MDLQTLTGGPADFCGSGYLYFDVFVPEGSEIMSIKFNHKDQSGNFGGCGNRGRWLSVEVPLAEQIADCQNWEGNGDFYTTSYELTVNPYNANRVDTGYYYINNLRLSPDPLPGDYLDDRPAPRPEVANNQPYTITWDDDELLARQQAHRTFEATTQHLTTGKFGNPTRAIRAYGTGQNRYICLLPDVEEMTGHPVNFHEVDSLFFRYYLTPESDEVSGATLFITSGEDWEHILMDTTFMTADDFQRGEWTYFARAIDDLNTVAMREPADVLTEVYEMRVDLHYGKEAGPIEIWWDDYGWK